LGESTTDAEKVKKSKGSIGRVGKPYSGEREEEATGPITIQGF